MCRCGADDFQNRHLGTQRNAFRTLQGKERLRHQQTQLCAREMRGSNSSENAVIFFAFSAASRSRDSNGLSKPIKTGGILSSLRQLDRHVARTLPTPRSKPGERGRVSVSGIAAGAVSVENPHETFFEGTAVRTLPNHDLGHKIKSGFGFGRYRLVGSAPVGFRDRIVTQTLTQILRMRHRLDTLGVHRLHLLDQFENTVKLALSTESFRFADLDTGEMSDALNLF